MNASEYEAVSYEHEVYCIGCLPDGIRCTDYAVISVAPIFADSSWDVYPVCCVCGVEHDYVVLLEAEICMNDKLKCIRCGHIYPNDKNPPMDRKGTLPCPKCGSGNAQLIGS